MLKEKSVTRQWVPGEQKYRDSSIVDVSEIDERREVQKIVNMLMDYVDTLEREYNVSF